MGIPGGDYRRLFDLAGGGKGLKYLAKFPFSATALLVMMVASIYGVWVSERGALAQAGGVFQGGQKFVTITTASTNCQMIAIPGPHQILEISLQTSQATVMYLHLYDIATVPVAGALPGQIGVYTIPGNTGNGFPTNLGPLGASVQNGIGFCITANPALADATVSAAGGLVNWTVK